MVTTESIYEVNNFTNIMDENTNITDLSIFLTQKFISDTYVKKILVPSIIYTCILFIIGVPGNALVTYVYFFKLKRKPFSVFIVALAAFDLINCLISMPTEVAILLNFFIFDHPVICKISRFVTFYMNAASCMVLLGIAIARFKAICFPLAKWNVKTKLTVISSMIFAAVTCWPAIFLYGTRTVIFGNNTLGKTVTLKTCLIDDKYLSTIYPDIHSYYLLGSTLFLDSCFIILYSLTGIKVFRQRNFGLVRKASKMSNSSLDDETKLKRNAVFNNSARSSTRSIPELFMTRIKNAGKDTNSEDSLEPFIRSGIRLLDVNPKQSKQYLDPQDSKSACIVRLSQSDDNLTLERVQHLNSERSNTLAGCPLISKGDSFTFKEGSKRGWNNKRSPFSRERDLSCKSPSLKARFIFSSSRSVGRTYSVASEQYAHGRNFVASRTAKMLFAVTLLFLLTFLPYCVIVIIRIRNPNFYEQQTDLQKTFYNLFLRSYMLSSALNPLIYNFYNKRFRTECKNLLKSVLCFLHKRSR